MLIRFSLQNWQCFRDRTTFSMIATREEQHSERLFSADKYETHLLPIAAIYGGNASGKTKFWKALEFAQDFIVKVNQPESLISREYFKLDSTSSQEPSAFTFEFLINNDCYEFSFAVTDREVVEEKLIKINTTAKKLLYSRENEKIITEIHKNDPRLQFVAEGTRNNQLFLTNSVNQKIDYFKPIYDWFKHSLVLISPQTNFLLFKDTPKINDFVCDMDTGIERVQEKNISIENLQIPEKILLRLKEELSEGETGVLRSSMNDYDHILITKENSILIAKKIITYHKSANNNEVAFELSDESAGTLRLLDLLPVFLDLIEPKKQAKIYIIDELDRCLHTLLTRNLLEKYLNSCSKSTRTQLIFTTHDLQLMDQKLLRRDEMWLAERSQLHGASLHSISDYKIPADKNILENYLQGRFGGIPKIFS